MQRSTQKLRTALPWYRWPPRRLDEGAAPHQFESPESYYRSPYFEALDLVSEQISTRLNQESMSVPKDLEKLLTKAANEQTICAVDVPNNLLSVYSKDVDFERAKLQLQMLLDLVKAYKQSQGLSRLEITSMRTMADILNEIPMAKDMFSEVDTLLRIYFTVPITTCTAERSFFCLRHIKTYLWFTMTEECLNNVMILHAYKEDTDQLNLHEIASMFVSVNDRRSFFGQF